MEPQSNGPLPTGSYDFIMNPAKPPKRGPTGGISGNSFIIKIVFLVGGLVVVMIVVAVAMNIFLGDKTNLDTIVSLAQTEQEIARVNGTLSRDLVGQPLKEASMNTELTAKSHIQTWNAFLAKYDRKTDATLLALKQDATTDKRLQIAVQTSTFDNTFTSIVRKELTDYAAEIKQAYQGATNTQEKTIMNSQYKDVQLLLKQWPQ
jgi:hypothetical protein